MDSSSSVSTLEVPNLFTYFDPAKAISVLFALLFILWLVYTLVATYHWLRYGHKSAVAIPALVVHVLMSGYLAIFAVSGLHP